VGGGAWGTALAAMLAQRGRPVTLVCRRAEQAAAIADTRRNPAHLPELRLPDAVGVRHLGDEDALGGAGLVALAVPSRGAAEAAAWLAPRLPAGAGVLSLTRARPRQRPAAV